MEPHANWLTLDFTGVVLNRLALLLFSCLVTVRLTAQDAGATLLPDIDPQDIEIRGDFTARFAGITRQPILGFSPTPRVFRIDANRMPFLESQEQVVASLPISEIDRPVGPEYKTRPFPERHRVLTNAAFGNHWTPEAAVYAEVPLSDRTLLLTRTNFQSSDGYPTSQRTSFRMHDADVAIVRNTSNRSRWTIGAFGRSDFSYFNAVPGFAATLNGQNEAGGYLQWRHHRNAYSQTELNVRSGYTALPTSNNETKLDASIDHSFTLATPGQWMSATLSTSNGLTGWGVNNARVAYNARIGSTIHTRIGANTYYGFDAVNGGAVFIAPDIQVQFKHPSGMMIVGEINGYMENEGLSNASRLNRFYSQYTTSENETGYRVRGLAQYAYRSGIRFEAGAEIGVYSNYGYYDASASNLTRNYADARILKIHGAASVDIVPETFTAFGTIYLQNAALDGNIAIPFHDIFGGYVGLTARPAFRILTKAWVDFSGPRKSDLVGTQQWGYALINAQFDYRFNRRFGLYIKGTNLLNKAYNPWVGYPMLPIQAFGGFTLLF